MPHCNIYQQKFDAHYGSSASSIGLDRLHRVRAETLFPRVRADGRALRLLDRPSVGPA